MHIHVFAIDLLPLGGLKSSGGGLRSLQMIRGLEQRGIKVTYSLPADNSAVKEHWYQLSAAEREDAFSSWDKKRSHYNIIRKFQPDAAIYMWPMLFIYPKSFKSNHTVIFDINGLQNVEGALAESSASAAQPSLRNSTIRYINKLSCADILISGSASQATYWSTAHSLLKDSFSGLTTIEIPYHPYKMPAALPYAIGEPTFYITGSFLPWNTPENFLRHTVSVIREKGKGRIVVVGKPDPNFHHSGPLIAELNALKKTGFATIVDAMDYDSYSSMINGNGIAVDLNARTVERDLAVPIRSVTFLAHGVPLITNDYSAFAKELIKYNASWHIDPSHSDKFKKIIADIIDGAENANANLMSGNARKFVSEALDPGNGFNILLEKISIDRRKKVTPSKATRDSASISPRARNFFNDRAKAPVVLICTDDVENFISVRIKVPFDAMYRAGVIAGYIVLANSKIVRQLGASERLETIDLIWVQRGALSYFNLIHEHFHGRYVYDLDDNLLITPAYRTPYSPVWTEVIKNFMEGAACVTVTTPRLVDSLQRASGVQIEHKIVLAPNLIETVTPRRFFTPPEALLIAASDALPLTASRSQFFKAINGFCNMRNIPILYIGTSANAFKEIECKIVSTGFLEYDVYKAFLRNENVIAIAPLDLRADDITQEFIDCKSDIKMVEFGAVGIPAVYSAAAPYADSPLEVGPLVDCGDTKAVVDALDYVWDNVDYISKAANESVASQRLADAVVVDTWGRALEAARLPFGMSLVNFMAMLARSRLSQTAGSVLVSEKEFNAEDYLAMNPDISGYLEANSINAYQHYVTKGFREGRNWFPATTKGESLLSAGVTRRIVLDELNQLEALERQVKSLI
jgi:hypothetical protein